MRNLFDRHALAERLGEDIGWVHRERKPVPVHETARRAGRQDGLEGHRRHAGRWPSGTYGHADYELGHCAGDDERRLMEEVKEIPPAVGPAA